MQIGERRLGADTRPFVVAEMSGNHNQSLDRALAIVDAAADAGADAVKLQTYTADTITLDVQDGDFVIADPASPWTGRNLHELYRAAYTPWEWHRPIFDHARHRGLICFSSPFDETAVDFLETLNVPAYKIASFELVHLPLIRKAAATGKPLVLSTGMGTLDEITAAVTAARAAGCRELVLLKCTSTYPAPAANSNLRTIPDLRATFGCEVGLSDHTTGIGVAVAAVAQGAVFIEKHLTLSRTDGGVDSTFSMEPHEFRMLVDESARAWEALGQVNYGPTDSERASMALRRSIYIAEDIPAGTALSAAHLRVVRPGGGLAPAFYEAVLGRVTTRDARKGTPLTWDLLR
jgi:N-acetylneuraminate synthase